MRFLNSGISFIAFKIQAEVKLKNGIVFFFGVIL